ncbi:galactose-specific lectin nattectin-like [Xyrauchen texanus]|uniref:galactose-specific lectin nattectin-like n=1 Tax=Xyrauchen texanus TaxID=154827 RepID=UPI002241F312|nr:galactose-specific lectin nattectin-like [Xyrauchen texanus]
MVIHCCLIMRIHLFFVLFSVLSLHVSSQPPKFYFIPVNMTWTTAQTYCRQHYTDLATINDQTDVSEIVKVVPKDMQSKYIWIGLYKTDAGAPWIWSDQSSFTFRWWASGQPNNYNGKQFCASTCTDGFWCDEDCSVEYTSICHKEIKTQIVRVEIKSSQNVNDPEVKKEILKKIEQKLNEKGFPENATLSWTNQSDGNVFQKKVQKNDTTDQTCH